MTKTKRTNESVKRAELARIANAASFQRAKEAKAALGCFMEQTDLTLRVNDGLEEHVTCLVSALNHFCDYAGLDFNGIVERAKAMHAWDVDPENEGN